MILKGYSYAGRHDELEVKQVVGLINLDTLCSRYSCLPSSGGLLDQDSRIIQGLMMVASAYAAREEKELEKQRKELQKNAS